MGVSLLVLNVPGLLGDDSGPVNTVAPAITADAVIGTANTGTPGTWTGAPTLTYQWQRNTGSWADITGATNIAYTPVDASFGYALRLLEIPNGDVSKAAASNTTNLVKEAPAQSLSAELITNGTFAAWTGDNPNNWAVTGESGSDPMVNEVGAGEGHGGAGTGLCNLYSSATAANPRIQQNVLTVGTYVQVGLLIDTVAAGSITVFDAAGGGQADYSTTGSKLQLFRATNAGLQIRGGLTADVTIDTVTAKNLTLNAQLTAPSADMKIDLSYTPPATPILRSQLWLFTRISNFASGNFWLTLLDYTGSQWNINVYAVASFVRGAAVLTASNVGATNMVRLVMVGDQVSLYTSANGGTNWTQRDTTKTNTTYQTATGVNALWTSDFTPGNLIYTTP